MLEVVGASAADCSGAACLCPRAALLIRAFFVGGVVSLFGIGLHIVTAWFIGIITSI